MAYQNYASRLQKLLSVRQPGLSELRVVLHDTALNLETRLLAAVTEFRSVVQLESSSIANQALFFAQLTGKRSQWYHKRTIVTVTQQW